MHSITFLTTKGAAGLGWTSHYCCTKVWVLGSPHGQQSDTITGSKTLPSACNTFWHHPGGNMWLPLNAQADSSKAPHPISGIRQPSKGRKCRIPNQSLPLWMWMKPQILPWALTGVEKFLSKILLSCGTILSLVHRTERTGHYWAFWHVPVSISWVPISSALSLRYMGQRKEKNKTKKKTVL